MVLEGAIRLEHEGQHSVDLAPYQMDTFSGDWKTRSYGKGTDFNLMMDDTCFGELMHLSIPAGASFNVALQSDAEFDRYYSMVTEAYYCLGARPRSSSPTATPCTCSGETCFPITAMWKATRSASASSTTTGRRPASSGPSYIIRKRAFQSVRALL